MSWFKMTADTNCGNKIVFFNSICWQRIDAICYEKNVMWTLKYAFIIIIKKKEVMKQSLLWVSTVWCVSLRLTNITKIRLNNYFLCHLSLIGRQQQIINNLHKKIDLLSNMLSIFDIYDSDSSHRQRCDKLNLMDIKFTKQIMHV